MQTSYQEQIEALLEVRQLLKKMVKDGRHHMINKRALRLDLVLNDAVNTIHAKKLEDYVNLKQKTNDKSRNS